MYEKEIVLNKKYINAIEYLLKNTSVSVKYRTITELCEEYNFGDIQELKNALEASEKYKKIFYYLKKEKNIMEQHFMQLKIHLIYLWTWECGIEMDLLNLTKCLKR